MRAEITKLHKELKTTTIYVTHDQTEAMTMASRIVVLKDGVIQQVGTPREIYAKPNNIFVGSFIGAPAMNFIEGMLTESGLDVVGMIIPLSSEQMNHLKAIGYMNKGIVVGVRPEHIRSSDKNEQSDRKFHFQTNVELAELTGSETILHVKLNEKELIAKVDAIEPFEAGQTIEMTFDFENIHFFDQETTERIELNQVGMDKDETVTAM